MMFFNKKSEIDKIREDIEGVILYFKKDNEMNYIETVIRLHVI